MGTILLVLLSHHLCKKIFVKRHRLIQLWRLGSPAVCCLKLENQKGHGCSKFLSQTQQDETQKELVF